MSFWNSLRIAFAMYSRIPVPKADWTKKNMQNVMCCFPLVGLFVGVALLAAYRLLASCHFGAPFRTILLILLPVWITGGIHLDGYLDTVDARSSYQSRERRLEILKDAHVGAFAMIGALTYFLLSYGIWTEVTAVELPVISLSFGFSRVLSGYAVVAWKNARGDGLAAQFQEAAGHGNSKAVLVAEGLLLAAGMFMLRWQSAAFALVAAGVCFLYYHWMAYRQFGGITGDLAGWFLQVCELAMAGSIVIGEKIWFY